MKKAFIILLAVLVCMAAGLCIAEGKTVEEIMIDASMGELYGVLTIPETEEPVPLIILSHGFGGNHSGNNDYSDQFVKDGFAAFNLDFCGGGWGSRSAGKRYRLPIIRLKSTG